MFQSARKPLKNYSNNYIIYNQWFRVVCIIFHILQNTNLQTLLETSILFNFQIRACLNQHHKSKKLILIIVYLIISDLGWLILFCVTYQPYQWLSTKKKKKEKKEKEKPFKTFLQAFYRNFSWISLNYIIYKTSTDHTLID